MKTILFASDFSTNSNVALHYALYFAKTSGARLIVNTIFDASIFLVSETESAVYPEIDEKMLAINSEKLKRQIEHIPAEWKSGVQIIEDVTEHTSIVGGLVDLVEKHHADLVVLGSKGDQSLTEKIFGSTTTGMIGEAICPVLVIPHDATFRPIEKIVYASAMDQGDFAATAFLAKIVNVLKASLHFIHLADGKNENELLEFDQFSDLLLDTTTLTNVQIELQTSQSFEEGLLFYLEEEKADLLVMLERKESNFFARLFHRDHVKEMSHLTTIPLLSIPKK